MGGDELELPDMSESFDPMKDWSEVEWVVEETDSGWSVFQPPFALAPLNHLCKSKDKAEALVKMLNGLRDE